MIQWDSMHQYCGNPSIVYTKVRVLPDATQTEITNIFQLCWNVLKRKIATVSNTCIKYVQLVLLNKLSILSILQDDINSYKSHFFFIILISTN